MSTETQKTDWNKYAGKRLLIEPYGGGSLAEVTVEEISPAGRVKFRWSAEYSQWEESNDYVVVEVLP